MYVEFHVVNERWVTHFVEVPTFDDLRLTIKAHTDLTKFGVTLESGIPFRGTVLDSDLKKLGDFWETKATGKKEAA
jgi:hypothetical protein